jgi:hypothetical protein
MTFKTLTALQIAICHDRLKGQCAITIIPAAADGAAVRTWRESGDGGVTDQASGATNR